MKKILLLILSCILLLCCELSTAQTDIGKSLDSKMEQASAYLQKDQDIPKAWETMVQISKIIKAHPDYNDGEYAEGMNDIVTQLLMKPWKYAKPYLTGSKSTASFREVVVGQINELSTKQDLKVIKKNISKNCDQKQYSICRELIVQVDKSMT